MKKTVEINCGSYYDALQAEYGGASRIQLSSSSGLTPTLAELLKVKDNTNLEVICNVKSRHAGYCYGDEDFEVMKLDAEILLDNGADGISFGCLDEEGDINISRVRQMVNLIKSYNKIAVFNHAIDSVNDIDEAINILITIGVDCVLTSGMQSKASNGKNMIKYLQEAYGKSIDIMAGGKIDGDNVKSIIDYTGINYIQSSCKDDLIDSTDCLGKDNYNAVRFELVEIMVELVEEPDGDLV